MSAVVFIAVAPGTLAGWLPWSLADWRRPRLDGATGAAGLLLAVGGWAVLLWCARDFAVRGRGTPAPYDAPLRLVVDGLYRFVRNPMYVGVLTSVVGEAMLFRSTLVWWYAGVLGVGFHLRVTMYEEPTLSELFGESFVEYRTRVPRWIPRLRIRGG